MNDLCVGPNTVVQVPVGARPCIFYVLIRSVEHEKHKQNAIISTRITSDGLYDSYSVLQGIVGLKWLCITHIICRNHIFFCRASAGLLPVFCRSSDDICTKNLYISMNMFSHSSVHT